MSVEEVTEILSRYADRADRGPQLLTPNLSASYSATVTTANGTTAALPPREGVFFGVLWKPHPHSDAGSEMGCLFVITHGKHSTSPSNVPTASGEKPTHRPALYTTPRRVDPFAVVEPDKLHVPPPLSAVPSASTASSGSTGRAPGLTVSASKDTHMSSSGKSAATTASVEAPLPIAVKTVSLVVPPLRDNNDDTDDPSAFAVSGVESRGISALTTPLLSAKVSVTRARGGTEPGNSSTTRSAVQSTRFYQPEAIPESLHNRDRAVAERRPGDYLPSTSTGFVLSSAFPLSPTSSHSSSLSGNGLVATLPGKATSSSAFALADSRAEEQQQQQQQGVRKESENTLPPPLFRYEPAVVALSRSDSEEEESDATGVRNGRRHGGDYLFEHELALGERPHTVEGEDEEEEGSSFVGTEDCIIWASIEFLRQRMPWFLAQLESERKRDRLGASQHDSPRMSYVASGSSGGPGTTSESQHYVYIPIRDILSIDSKTHHVTSRERRVQMISFTVRDPARARRTLSVSQHHHHHRSGQLSRASHRPPSSRSGGGNEREGSRSTSFGSSSSRQRANSGEGGATLPPSRTGERVEERGRLTTQVEATASRSGLDGGPLPQAQPPQSTFMTSSNSSSSSSVSSSCAGEAAAAAVGEAEAEEESGVRAHFVFSSGGSMRLVALLRSLSGTLGVASTLHCSPGHAAAAAAASAGNGVGNGSFGGLSQDNSWVLMEAPPSPLYGAYEGGAGSHATGGTTTLFPHATSSSQHAAPNGELYSTSSSMIASSFGVTGNGPAHRGNHTHNSQTHARGVGSSGAWRPRWPASLFRLGGADRGGGGAGSGALSATATAASDYGEGGGHPLHGDHQSDNAATAPILITSLSNTLAGTAGATASSRPAAGPKLPVPCLRPRLTPLREPEPPLMPEEWAACFTSAGDGVIDVERLESAALTAYRGGIDPSIRLKVWMHLLKVFPSGSSAEERAGLLSRGRKLYETLSLQWQSVTEEQEAHFSALHQRKFAVEKDVQRTDRTMPQYKGDDAPKLSQLRNVLMAHVMVNFDLGYTQGMSDVASILCLQTDDAAEAFLCFRALLAERMLYTFTMDTARGIPNQLRQVQALVRHFEPTVYAHLKECQAENMAFCFRWLLMAFKREFDAADTMRLWDTLLACPYTAHFDLIVAVALIRALAPQIIAHCHTCVDVMQFINTIALRLPVESVIAVAQEFHEEVCAAVPRMERLAGRVPRETVPGRRVSVEEAVELCLALDGPLDGDEDHATPPRKAN